MLRVGSSTLTVTDDGISLVAPKVEISASTITITGTTDINSGALQIT
jgi:autotransporter-associated beta strand protein